MLSNLPPGVTDSMIPGNEPDDFEKEFDIVLAGWEIQDLIDFNNRQLELSTKERDPVWPAFLNLMEQILDTIECDETDN